MVNLMPGTRVVLNSRGHDAKNGPRSSFSGQGRRLRRVIFRADPVLKVFAGARLRA
jgi:hypothetical protein